MHFMSIQTHLNKELDVLLNDSGVAEIWVEL